MAELHYNEAIKHVRRRARAAAEHALRGDAEGAGTGGADVREGPEGGRQHCSRSSASANAIAWQQDWLKLGDVLLGKYAHGHGRRPDRRLPAVVERRDRLQAADSVRRGRVTCPRTLVEM